LPDGDGVGSIGAQAQLAIDFYDDSCPQIYDIVRAEIQKAVATETRIAASLVRVHFHDCFVNVSECLAIWYHARIYGTDAELLQWCPR